MRADPVGFAPYPSTLVVQPTPLCNLRCTYCYLPNLSDRHRMAPGLACKLAHELADWPSPRRIDVVWHGGEPLTTGRRHLGELMSAFDGLREQGRVRHGLQTNATLVDDEWCKLLVTHDVQVGVSIDGPRWTNVARRSLSGAEAFDRAVRGIATLRDHSIGFHVIAVVSLTAIPAIITRVDEYLAFFAALGAREVGFNIEEHEGHHHVDPDDGDLVDMFWQAILAAWLTTDGTLRVRDFDRVLAFAESSLAGRRQPPRIDLLPTISSRGDVVLLSPELAGYHSHRYGDFVVGNLALEPLASILRRGLHERYVKEFQAGTEHCRVECSYFDFCQGGQAANRFFEHGDLLTNETAFCRRTRQAPFAAVVDLPRRLTVTHQPERR